MLRNTLKLIFGLLFILVVTIGLTSIKHPIILKWISGSARIIGKPIDANVYADNQLNTNIKVFHINSYWNNSIANYYLLYSPNKTNSQFRIICINPKDKYASVPTSTNIRDYDMIFGHLFQSDVGAKFIPSIKGIKGFDLNPKFTENQIEIDIPLGNGFEFHSIRLVL